MKKAVQDIEDFRRRRRDAVHTGDLGDFAAFQRISGRCPGCHARRSQLVTFHDADIGRRPEIFTRTIPHYRCNGKRVLRQQIPLKILQAQRGEVGE